MRKYLACFALLAGLFVFSPAPISAANAAATVQTAALAVQHDEISARRYYYRAYRPVRVYRPYRVYKPYRVYRPYRAYRYYR